MNCGKSYNCLDRRMKNIILERITAECGLYFPATLMDMVSDSP